MDGRKRSLLRLPAGQGVVTVIEFVDSTAPPSADKPMMHERGRDPGRQHADDLSIAFLGTYPPRMCGIATFTHDLSDAVIAADESVRATVLAMTDADSTYEQPERVRFEVRRGGGRRLPARSRVRQRQRYPARLDPARVRDLRRDQRRACPRLSRRAAQASDRNAAHRPEEPDGIAAEDRAEDGRALRTPGRHERTCC